MLGAVVLLAALGVAAPAGASDAPEAAVTFQVGLTHTQQSVDDEPESRASAEALLETVGPLQNQHLMGWGAENPEPEPGVYDWSSLDERIALIERTGGVPVITLCSAPGRMKGADDCNMDAAPTPEHYDDFADLAVETARRCPQVRYFQVRNELKGFQDEERNRWDHEGYTELYNLLQPGVYTRLKEHDPDLIVGGPYVSLNVYADPEGMSHPSDLSGDWGTVDQLALDGDLSAVVRPAGEPGHFTLDGRTLAPFHLGDEAPYHASFRRSEPVIAFRGADFGVQNRADADGTTYLDRLWSRAPFRDRSAFPRTARTVADEWRAAGRLDATERSAVLAAAERADLEPWSGQDGAYGSASSPRAEVRRAARVATAARSSGPPSTRKSSGTFASHSWAYIVGLRVLPTSTHPSPDGSRRPMGGRIQGATRSGGASNTTRVANSQPVPRCSSRVATGSRSAGGSNSRVVSVTAWTRSIR